ncbi:MAG: hypothetical protein MJ181_08555 [Treponema sp.]|nr:hypothetical protein [Treponema sp.]
MKSYRTIISFLVLFSVFSSAAFCADNSPEKYNQEEIPQSLQDFRRFEIVTLGALPFVMMDATLVYSGTTWALNGFSGRSPTPFASSNKFSTTEQKNLVLASLGVSVGVGLTDLIVRLVKRKSENKRKEIFNSRDILIEPVTPVSEDPEAYRIDLPGGE